MEKNNLWDQSGGSGIKFLEWWESLDANRGDRAELRRCTTLYDVVMTPAFQKFYRRIGYGTNDTHREAIAAIAGLAALVKTNSDKSLVLSMENREDENKPLVSGLRFRNLLKCDGTEELYGAVRRILPLIKYQTSIHLLGFVRQG